MDIKNKNQQDEISEFENKQQYLVDFLEKQNIIPQDNGTMCCPFHLDNKESATLNVDINSGYNPKIHCYACSENSGDFFADIVFKKDILKTLLGLSDYPDLETVDKKDLDYLHKVFNNSLGKSYIKNKQAVDKQQVFSPLNMFNTNYSNLKNKLYNLWDFFCYDNNRKIYLSNLLTSLGVCYSSKFLIKLPIYIKDTLLGFKFYTNTPAQGQAKSKVSFGVNNGWIIPYNLIDNSPILICEGEKDMITARLYGYNAITITGGAQALPQFCEIFKDKEVWIVYDNDDAGKSGGIRLANHLLKYTNKVKNITVFHSDLKNKGDIYDFFKEFKDNGVVRLNNYIEQTPYHTFVFLEGDRKAKQIPYYDVQKEGSEYELLESVVEISAISETPKSIKQILTLKIFQRNEDSTIQRVIDIDLKKYRRYLYLIALCNGDEKNIKSIFPMILSNKEILQTNNIPEDLEIDYKKDITFSFSGNNISVYESIPVHYIDTIKNGFETNDSTPITIPMFSLDKLTPSQIYSIKYERLSHKLNKQSLNTIAIEVKEVSKSFKVFDRYKDLENHRNNLYQNSIQKWQTYHKNTLNRIQYMENGLLKTQEWNATSCIVETLYQSLKTKVPFVDFNLWLIYELTFNSVLAFYYDKEITNGVVYSNIIGDTRTGKSHLAKALINQYGRGEIVDTKNSTLQALIGGQVKEGNTQFIKAGKIPQNNEGLIVLEELHSMKGQFFKSITEVKSSGELRISRVAGDLKLSCRVRILEISNPQISNAKSDAGGSANSVYELPNIYIAIKNLIPDAEDIARNDIYYMLPTTEYVYSNPKTQELMYPDLGKDFYVDKLNFVWSRKPEDIIFDFENAKEYIVSKAEKLQELLSCSGVTIFTSETPKKLMKLSIALAGLVLSFEGDKIVVRQEHIDYIYNFLIYIYTSDIAGLDTYVANTKQYINVDIDLDDKNLQDLWNKYQSGMEFLRTRTQTKIPLLKSFMGDSASNLNNFIDTLNRCGFIRHNGGDEIQVTQRLNQAFKRNPPHKLNQNTQQIYTNVYVGGNNGTKR